MTNRRQGGGICRIRLTNVLLILVRRKGSMNSRLVALYTLGVILGVAIAIAPFVRRFRGGSSWLRHGLFITGLLAIANNLLGFYLLVHDVHGKTSLRSSWFWALDHLKLFIAYRSRNARVSVPEPGMPTSEQTNTARLTNR